MVSKLLGRSKLWPAAVVSDADFAVSAAAARWFPDASVQHEAPSGHSLQIGRGSVTAACQAAVSGEVFLGFENGLVCVFQPERELVFELPTKDGTVAALAVDPQGQTLAALYESRRGPRLRCFSRRPDGSYKARPEIELGRRREALADADPAHGGPAAGGGERRPGALGLRRGFGPAPRAAANRRG